MRKLSFFLFIILLSCSSRPEIPGFDSEGWKEDLGGCNGNRLEQINTTELEEALVGLTESEIVQLMGKPDQNELYKRNQKFYVYELGPCGDVPSPYLQIRFSATNIAREAMIYEP